MMRRQDQYSKSGDRRSAVRHCCASTSPFGGRRVAPIGGFCTRVLALLLLLGFTSCSITKYLPKDEFLYDGSSVRVKAPKGVETAELGLAVTGVLNNNTNTKLPLLGYYEIYRWYKFEEKLAAKPEKFAKKDHWGREPVFYDETLVESVNVLLENRASNEGYFNNEADWTLDTNRSTRTVSASYELEVGRPYTINSVRYFWRDSSIARVINPIRPSTRLKEGIRYELDVVRAERQRWENALRNAGFYYARGEDYLFLADTVAGDHQVDLLAKLKDGTPRNHLLPQRIVAINVYPNAEAQDSASRYSSGDTSQIGGLKVICQDCPLRAKIIDEAFEPAAGDLYNPLAHQKTLQRLADYNTFRYIAMSYDPVAGSDSALVLNAFLQPRLPRRFEGEIGLSYNSADYFGPNVKLAYVNRNLLRGAELLRVEGDFTYAQFLGSAGEARVPRSGIYGLSAKLNVPRLWLPKRRKLIPRVYTSGTVIEIGGKIERLSMNLAQFTSEIEESGLRELATKLESDPEATESLSLMQLRAQFGYTWKRRVVNHHQLNPLSIRFQNPSVTTEEVLELARQVNLAPGANDNTQANRFDRMLVFSPSYTLTNDTRLAGLKTHTFFWKQFVSMNRNNVFPVGANAASREKEVSFYPLVETDFRYYLTFNKQQQLATRFHGGVAFPLFSDRAIVPYFDLFSIGGPNSLRGFAPRQIGPGRTVPFANNLLTFGGFGNLILEGSVEFRQRLNDIVELAIFADAGNIWTYKTELEDLDTDFKTDAFSGDVALDAGVGVRFDLQFLVLRIDLAQPLMTPYDEAAVQLVIPREDARDVPEDGLRLVVAFGYPF